MKLRKKRRLLDKKPVLAAIALAALAASPNVARADDTAAEIKLLKERLKQLEAKVAKQDREQKAAQARVPAAPPPMVCKDAPCPPPPEVPPPVWVSFKNGLSVESYDHAFAFRIGGRLFVDGGVVDEPLTGKSGNAGIRRARLEVIGRAFEYWNYKLQYDFAGSTSSGTVQGGIRDAYLYFKHPALAILPFTDEPVIPSVGNMYEPMGLEQLTSSKYIDFIERSLPSDVLTPSRHIGAALGAHGKEWSAKVGIFSTSPEDTLLAPPASVPPGVPFPGFASVSTGGGQYFDITGRVTYAPILEKDALLHIGGSGRYHQENSATGANDNRVLFLGSNSRSEANILGMTLLGTPDLSCGTIFTAAGAQAGRCTNNVVGYGAELVGSYGPFSVQAEFMGAQYNRSASNLLFANLNGAGVNALGGTSLNFSGYYVYGTWYLTGESRAESYKVGDFNSASFEQIKILSPLSAGGIGAWELAARFSELNLNSGGVLGGSQSDITVGLNWYPDRGIRFMANYINVVQLGAPFNRPFINGAHPNIFLMRAQVDW